MKMREMSIGYAAIIFLSIIFTSFHSSRGFTSSVVSQSVLGYSACTPLTRTKLLLKSTSNDNISRRESILKITSAATATISICTLLSSSKPALAVEEINNSKKASVGSPPKKELTEYESKRNKFSISVPSTFSIITNKIGSDTTTSGQIFSALDLNSGTVITVHRESACPIDQYVSQPKTCDFVLPNEADGPLLSEQTMKRDATKMIIRHDDRDNAVLGGTSTLQSIERVKDGPNDGIVMVANTILPTGGTYQDEMGLRRESTITRVVKARVVVQTGESGSKSFLGVWISSPLDEWQKPVMGTRLRQIIQSICIEGGQL